MHESKSIVRLRRILLRGWHRYVMGAKRWRVVVQRSSGLKFLVQYSGMGKELLLEGAEHEADQLGYFKEMMSAARSDILIDVGANMGTYSMPIAASELVQKAYAIEGSYTTYNSLCKNISLNQLDKKIEAIHAVVSDTEELLSWHEHKQMSSCGSGLGEIFSKKYNSPNDFTVSQVRARPLDMIFSYRNCSLAVKIDVEGHELKVLQGANSLLTGNKVVMQIEIWPEYTSNLNWLYNNGYRAIFRIDNDYFLRNF